MKLEEKYLKYGCDALTEVELLQLMLYIIGEKYTKVKAKKLLKTYANLANILARDNYIFENDISVPIKFKILKKLLIEIFYKDYLQNFISNEKKISDTASLINFLRQELAYELKERFDIIFLTTNLNLIKHETIFKGTIDRSIVFLREIITKVLCLNAKNIIIAHNHPSGSLIPSNDDIKVTLKIKEGLKIFEINLLDHIIISKKGYFSFVEGGVL
ncbi:JAB domain-containing protein [Sneathia sanguinegens]|uniref:JAB domain-containing protein n=1 Tax=Sneathia sanguinegens TaxID=40543 RepID=UPI0023F78A77|nr:DNA repair protein RadC [Sneathia sanguinegens]MDU4652221.1 DNA repair protein RadC [Sneathia sanguinegens]